MQRLAGEWREATATWRALNAPLTREDGKHCPTQAHEYMLYQSLLGAWPLDGIDDSFVKLAS